MGNTLWICYGTFDLITTYKQQPSLQKVPKSTADARRAMQFPNSPTSRVGTKAARDRRLSLAFCARSERASGRRERTPPPLISSESPVRSHVCVRHIALKPCRHETVDDAPLLSSGEFAGVGTKRPALSFIRRVCCPWNKLAAGSKSSERGVRNLHYRFNDRRRRLVQKFAFDVLVFYMKSCFKNEKLDTVIDTRTNYGYSCRSKKPYVRV